MENLDLCNCIAANKNFFLDSSEDGRIFVSICNPQQISCGTVIIVPPYGRTVHDLFLLAAYLVTNNFKVLRFDTRNHVGLSSGTIDHYKISTIEKDLLDVLKLPAIEFSKPVILLGMSLSAPVVWKVATKNDFIKGVATLVGAVDIISTVEKAGNISLAPYFDRKKERDLYQEVLGLRVITQPFVDDLIENCYVYFEQIKNYILSLQCPSYMIAAGADHWVSLEQVKETIKKGNTKQTLLILDNVDHEVGKSAVAAKYATIKLVEFCNQIVGNAEKPLVPALTEIIKASTIESENLLNF